VATGPICRISEQGGEVTEVVRPDSSRGELALRWPEFLPDGNHFMFVSLPPRTQNFDIYVGSIDSRDRKHVMTSGAAPVCAGDAGLILASNGRLMVQRFDYRKLESVGAPFALGAASSSDASVGQRLACASMNGVLVQPTASLANTRLVWLDRSGREQGTVPVPAGRYEKMAFSPDGRRVVAVKRTSPNNVDLWMIDLERGHSTRFTSEPQSRIGGVPAWSPDGRRVAFSSNRSGPTNIYQMHVDAIGAEEPLYQTSDLFKETKSWSHDGRFLVFEIADAVTRWDLWLLPMDGDRSPIPYLRSKFGEVAGYVSPDGGWMSYSSDQSGRAEVYVRSFPKPGPEYQVTREGGLDGLWSSDGKEMLIVNRGLDNAVWSVAVSTTPVFHAEPPRLLFRVPAEFLWLQPTPDGERFLAAVPASAVEPPTIAVDLNWPAQIGR
jgi:Tol biopolymer transport system component